MRVVYIHGANASGESFNYIRDQLKIDNEIVLEYDSSNGFDNNLDMMKSTLVDYDNVLFVCHSLGGIYAVHLAHYLKSKVLGAITISTPYGGSKAADYAKFFLPFSRLLHDIGPRSKPIKDSQKIKIVHPWLNIVTTRGNCPWLTEDNDGVVTIESMKHRKDMEYIELPLNHYEVVISKETAKIINKKIQEYANGKIHRST
jgi:pimeloyl-ACP methyl ester carboxylesterase